MPQDADGEVHLILGVGVGVEAADDATEGTVPSHLQKVSDGAVVAAGDVTEEVILAVLVEDYLHGIGIVGVVHLALETHLFAHTEVLKYQVGIVILTSCQMAAHEMFLV